MGAPQFMASEGGFHPPEKWGVVTTNEILDLIVIESRTDIGDLARAQKEAIRPQLESVLSRHHAAVMQAERGEIQRNRKRVFDRLDPLTDAAMALVDVLNVLDGTMFGQHFRKQENANIVGRIIGQHFADSMHIERLPYLTDHEKEP